MSAAKMMSINRIARSTLGVVALFFVVSVARAGGAAPIRLYVSSEERGEVITYHYTIANHGTQPLNNFTVGSRFDSAKKESFPELGKLPIDWKYGDPGESGREIVLDRSSTTQPAGWVAKAFGQQDTALFYLRWEMSSDGQAKPISPGETLTGFSVSVPKGKDLQLIRMPAGSDLKYRTGHFAVILPDGTELHGRLERRSLSNN